MGCMVCTEAQKRLSSEDDESEYERMQGGTFGRALESGTMAVIRGSYFEDCARSARPFAHRAKIEEEAPDAVLGGGAAAGLWYKMGHKCLLVVSYCWLSKEHPDPQMFYLPYLTGVIAGMRNTYHIEEVGVILDYCSFYQAPRTDEQLRTFKECLRIINVPYGHKCVTAVKLVAVPAEERRTYDDRGWTKFESDVIDSKPASDKSLALFNVLTCMRPTTDLKSLSRCQRRPPVTPARFKAEMEERRGRAEGKGVSLFTNGKDQQFLEEKYAETFSAIASSTTTLIFTSKNIGDTGAEQLSEALAHFEQLVELKLDGNEMTGRGARSLAAALSAGGAPKLKSLDLCDNALGEEGAAALAAALSGGGAPLLESLWLQRSGVAGEGKAALREAAAGRDGHLVVFF